MIEPLVCMWLGFVVIYGVIGILSAALFVQNKDEWENETAGAVIFFWPVLLLHFLIVSMPIKIANNIWHYCYERRLRMKEEECARRNKLIGETVDNAVAKQKEEARLAEEASYKCFTCGRMSDKRRVFHYIAATRETFRECPQVPEVLDYLEALLLKQEKTK